MRHLHLIHVRPYVAPRIPTGVLDDAFSSQRQDAQRHVGVDAMGRPMKHRTHPPPTFERAPGLFHAVQVLVPQGQLGRGEALVVALDHAYAVAPLFRAVFRRLNPPQPAFGQAQLPTVTTARPQLPPPLGMPCTMARLQGCQCGFQCTQELLAMGFLPFRFLGVVTPDIAPTTVPRPHDNVLDSQVVCHALIAPRPL